MKRIICFAAHPDDIEFGCTGTLFKHYIDTYDLYYVILTNGQNGFNTGRMGALGLRR